MFAGTDVHAKSPRPFTTERDRGGDATTTVRSDPQADRRRRRGPHLPERRYREDDYHRTIALRALFHDLGNQLATFSCLVEDLDGDPELPARAHHHIAVMRTQTLRMQELLRHAVVQRPRPELVAIRPLIREIISGANARHHAAVTLFPGEEQWLNTYPSALWRVIDNIVDNAARAAGSAGRVEVSVHREHHKVVIEVADDGPGFGNAPAGTASLGLMIAVSLARQCEGQLEIQPDPPHGTRVRLEFCNVDTDEAADASQQAKHT